MDFHLGFQFFCRLILRGPVWPEKVKLINARLPPVNLVAEQNLLPGEWTRALAD
jgi:hypothetical protein